MPSQNVAHKLFVHFNWCTKERIPIIRDRSDEILRETINQVCREMGYEIIAVETVPDHVHLLVRFLPTHQLSAFIKTIKGRSSRNISRTTGNPFEWQRGYGINTVGLKALDEAKKYVMNQREHHKNNEDQD
ncbi:MAG: IS200/IS605 family transposase [bacterium]|nr:IS200/IS605 family transposase [bacterium]